MAVMKNRLYIGGLAWATTEDGLAQAFSQAGEVVSVKIIIDRETNRSRGFGFVEMKTEEMAQKAIEMFNGKDLDGRTLTVNIAREMEARPPRQGGFDRGPRDFGRQGGGSDFRNGGHRGGGFGGGNRSGGRTGGSGFRSGSR